MIWRIYIYNSFKYPVRWKKGRLVAPGVPVTPCATEIVLSPLVGNWWGQNIARAFTRWMIGKNIYIYISFYIKIKIKNSLPLCHYKFVSGHDRLVFLLWLNIYIYKIKLNKNNNIFFNYAHIEAYICVWACVYVRKQIILKAFFLQLRKCSNAGQQRRIKLKRHWYVTSFIHVGFLTKTFVY